MNNPKVAVGFLIFLGAAGPAPGQTKSYFDAQCSYTAPGPEWEWLDPNSVHAGEARTLAVVRNPSGLTFTLRYRPKDQRPDANSFESFEDSLLSSGQFRKLRSTRVSFKGASSYQIDVQSVRADECARIRVLYANEKAYQLSVTYTPGPLGPDEETDIIFKGFEFRSPQDCDDEAGSCAGPAWTGGMPVLWAAGLLGLLVFGVWTVIRIRNGG